MVLRFGVKGLGQRREFGPAWGFGVGISTAGIITREFPNVETRFCAVRRCVLKEDPTGPIVLSASKLSPSTSGRYEGTYEVLHVK